MQNSECPALKLIARGKVRDLYNVDDNSILFVATDRISAFDVVMKNGIKGKGKILTQISLFWFQYLKERLGVENHVITTNIEEMPLAVQQYKEQLSGRVMLVKKLKILPVEAIVRGYITGSAMVEYKSKGTVCDIQMPKGLVESQKLDMPLFTPSTKAELGDHDENIHPSKLPALIGDEYAKKVEELALKIYVAARDFAQTKGVIIADTKFEFGVDLAGNVILADEVLTPDSSRFWPMDKYQPGQSQPSFDKQYLRDYLLSIKFDKKNGVELPETSIASNSFASSNHTLNRRDERFVAQVTSDFPHLLGFNRLLAWMDKSIDPCNDFYQYSCGGFIKRYADFKDSSVMTIMGKSTQLLMKSILEQKESPLAKSIDEKIIFRKSKAYFDSCANKRLIQKRGFRPIIPIANSVMAKATSIESLPSLFGQLQAEGVDVLFRSKYTKVETKDPDDMRLQFFPAPAYEIQHSTVKSVLQIFVDNRVLPKGLKLEPISVWVAKLENENAKFLRHLNKLRHKSAFDNPNQFQTIQDFSEMTGMPWQDLATVLNLQNATKLHVWSGLKPWIQVFKKFNQLDRNKLQFYFLWRLASSHFNKLSQKYYDLWKNEIHPVVVKADFPEIDSDGDIFQEDCIEETGRNLRYLAGHLFIQYAFNDTQKANAKTMIDSLFDAFKERLEELDWMDAPTKEESLEKLKNIVRVIGYPEWLSNPKSVVDHYRPLKIDAKKYFENAVQAQVFTELSPAIQQSRHTSLDRGKTYFGYPWQLNAFHLTDLVLIQINPGVLQRPVFSELNPMAMNYGGIGTIIAHEITHGFDSVGSLLDSRGVRRHWMTERAHHELYTRSKCFVNQYNRMKVKLPDGSFVRPNGKKSLPENMADGGGMHTSFRAMRKHYGDQVDIYKPNHPKDPFSPAQTFFLSLGQSWCSEIDSAVTRYMIAHDVHSPNPARVHGSIANSPEFARAFGCAVGSQMVPRPFSRMCRAF